MASSVTSRGSSRADDDAAAEARCRAARDKLRIVREAMEAHAKHLQALDAYEVEKAAYLARRAPLDAAEVARRARSDAANAEAMAKETDAKTDAALVSVVDVAERERERSREGARDETNLVEEDLAASRAYDDAVAALGPVPSPPAFQDHLNDTRVAADGTEGPPLFLLTCGVLEGAGEQSVALLKELMARGARAENCVGSRPNHGKRLAPLCLALAHLERFADPGEPEPDTGKGGFFGADALLRGLGIVPGDGDDALGSEDASSETSSTSFFGASRSDAQAWRKTRVANDASDPGTPRSVARFGSEGSESGAEETESLTNEEKTPKLDAGGIEEDAKEAPFRGSVPEAEMDDLVAPFRPARLRDVKNAITALIAGGADVNARCRLGAFKDGRNETLAAPFRSVCAYRGVAGTAGDALFLATVAATSPETRLETRLACVDVAALLIESGADLEARGTRPGSGYRCGENLAPLAMALAAMEQDACASSGAYRDTLVRKNAGGGEEKESRFFEYALDAVDGNPNATLAAVLLAAKRKAPPDGSDAEFDDENEGTYEPAVDIGAVTTFSHVPTKREYRARRLAVGDTGDTTAAPASGPPVWHAACAAAEGAGAPAVAVARKLLKLGADPNAVGSRPGHCLPGTPALAMCVAALRGRARHPSRRRDQDWWPASESGSARGSAKALGFDADASVRSPSETNAAHVSPAAQRARAAFEAEVVRGLERFLEKNADREGVRADEGVGEGPPSSSALVLEDERVGFWSRVVGAPFVWSARAEAEAAAGANAIAVAHRDARLAAEKALRESAADLRTYVPILHDDDAENLAPDRSNREARARADALALTEAFVAARADCDAPMKVVSKHAAELETDDAFPLGIAVGLFSEGFGECARIAALTLMDRGGADVSARGVCAFPLVASPLFAATRAIRRNVPESVDLWRRLLEKGADVDGLGRFPEGSERTPLIELLHTLREGKVFRPGVLSLIRELVDLKCDVRAPRPEVYLPTPHAAYAFREDEDPGAEPGESSRGSETASERGSPSSLLSAAAEEAAEAFASHSGSSSLSGTSLRETAHANANARVRLSAARVDELVRTLSSTYGFDVTREQVRALVGETRERHAYTVSDSSGSDADEAVTQDSEALSQTESDKELGPGAFFPAWTPRTGRCEYAPLFWALEAVCGDGFDEARLAVELIARALGGDVDAPQGTNHHSHVTGSLAAMATAAAIHAAAPLSVPALAESVSSSAMRRGAKSEEDEGAEVFPAETKALITPDDGSAEPETHARDAEPAAVSTTLTLSKTSPSPSPTRAYAALAAAAAEANAKADLCDARKRSSLSQTSKLPPPAERSRFRSRARGVLGASRFEKATRLAAREKAREAAAAKMAAEEAELLARREDARARAWRGVGVRTKEGYEDTRVPRGGKANANGADAFVAAAADGREEDAPPGTLDAESEALHRDLDEIKKRNAPSVAGDDVASPPVAPPPGLMGALAALLGRDESTPADTGDAGAAAAEEAKRAARETRARMSRDRAARLDAVHKTATFFLRATKRIDAVCVNPLLMELGAASLAPFEYTPLFCALHGAATARGAEQMAVANELATLCLDRGANVSAPGAHASVGGVSFRDESSSSSSSSFREKEKEKETKTKSTTPRYDSALRSYPLMWAVAAALRGDSPHKRVDDTIALTKRVLMAGADPTSVNFAVAVRRHTSFERNDDDVDRRDPKIYASKVLHLWDERALLLEVFDQTEWQRVVTLRLKLCRLLGEAGARSAFRADSGMRSVATRAAPFVESSYPRDLEDESSSLERLKWAEGVRRTRQLLEHGGVPSQYAVWVWPTTEREAFPEGDRLAKKREHTSEKLSDKAKMDGDMGGDASTSEASEFEYAEAYRAPRPFGAPARACEIEVMPRRADMRRPGVRGAVDVSRVKSEDVFEEVSGDVDVPDVSADFAVRSRALASRLLWETRLDGVSERADAARRASVMAIRELLAGEPAEPPASSDSSDSEPEPFATASESSDASEYESRFAFVPKAPRRARLPAGQKKKSRGVVHAALVFMGFRKKKRRNEKKKPEEEDDARRTTTTTTTTTRAGDASKPPSRISASKDRVARVTLGSARAEALGTVAEALMRNPNSRQADRFHGVPSLAAMAKAETVRRETSRLSNTFEHGVRTELADASADPPPPAFGALGRYMRAVEREEAPDWNAATRRPMRRLLT